MSDTIVCLSSEPWQSIPTRTQQLMTRMQGAQVLFFEPPEAQGGTEYKKSGRKVRPGVTVYTLPPVWKTSRRGLVFRWNLRKMGEYIQGVLRRKGSKEPLLWCTNPENVHLLDYIPYRGLVYDCDRYWAGLPLDWESDLALNADVIFTASGGLMDRLKPCSENIAVVENGCNFPMFTRADIEVPGVLQGREKPLLGYIGTLWSDLDYEPVFRCAAAHPDWNFLFVGRQEPSPGLKKLKEMKRVILADRCPLIEVPDYIYQLDICMNLRRTGIASDVCSTRVFEALAAGKPVVRHSFPGQVADMPELMYQAEDLNGFVIECEKAMREDGVWLRGRRRDAGEEAAWDRRAQQVRTILEANMLLD